MTTELLRDHTGALHLYSDGRPVSGAVVNSVSHGHDGDLQAIVVVPLKHVTIGEMRNVIPLVRPPLAA